ncbi:hypothetical protein FRACYDRAFT_235487 [Fragilariopsis cylindrus CCMP1102]|uniref:Uncharacterized protein n=1 Tax=Fragilariopsis cylindrus CCMP1102 TaxID=635003 RepID=A0A1E7FMT2_9STRA|nr:hypothetical protein FRACYDRAFT_235487 [Fragilariopsis cylindrus CCMP1102]|eukprot:OEU19434.1 hypothetical protein FRACYDRAFT_235487 [Fragilariopsis cylindrus CCMP1102]
MKKVKEMAQTRSIPIWRYYTADQPAKTKVTRHVPTRKHVLPRRMSSNTKEFLRNFRLMRKHTAAERRFVACSSLIDEFVQCGLLQLETVASGDTICVHPEFAGSDGYMKLPMDPCTIPTGLASQTTTISSA